MANGCPTGAPIPSSASRRSRQIDTTNVKDLGVAWEFRTYSVRGLEATPIVSDGVMFITGPGARCGRSMRRPASRLWAYDPQVPGAWGRYACCDVVNRGVAVWKGAVYVGTLDGRLVKLDAKTGKAAVGHQHHRPQPRLHHHRRAAHRRTASSSSAMAARNMTRAAMSRLTMPTPASQVWRFYIVPGDPAKPQENAALDAPR